MRCERVEGGLLLEWKHEDGLASGSLRLVETRKRVRDGGPGPHREGKKEVYLLRSAMEFEGVFLRI